MTSTKQGCIQNEKELEFAIFCIENIAIKMKTSADRVYDAFVSWL